MDLSPELFEAVEFREKWRGYDPDEVDDFLERSGVAVGQLLDRLREANHRLEAAERALRERADADEAMRRTLVLAQRTADQAVAEAEERAERIRTMAEQRAREIVAAAESQAAEHAAEAQRQLRADVGQLESARDRLRADVEALERYVTRQRERIRADLESRLAAIESGAAFRLDPAPSTADVELPEPPAVPAPPAPVAAEPAGEPAAAEPAEEPGDHGGPDSADEGEATQAHVFELDLDDDPAAGDAGAGAPATGPFDDPEPTDEPRGSHQAAGQLINLPANDALGSRASAAAAFFGEEAELVEAPERRWRR